MSRISEAECLMLMAEAVARRGTCSRLQVGAVLAVRGRACATGFNGAPAGLAHCVHVDDEPCTVAVHAEGNAVAFAARHGVAAEGAALFVTHAPCKGCASLLINAGVGSVVFGAAFRDMSGVDLLTSAGVRVERHSRL